MKIGLISIYYFIDQLIKKNNINHTKANEHFAQSKRFKR
jgi:hypothetical protein